MTTNLTAVLVLTLLGVASEACASAPRAAAAAREARVVVTHEQLSEAGDKIDRRVEVALGRQLTIQLSSNPASTNYKWTEAALSNKTVLRQTSHVFVKPPLKNPRIVGAPGYQVWTFRTVQRGKTSIDMRYLPRDDRQDEGTKFHLDVVVK